MDDLETLSDVNNVLANEISDMIREFEAKDFDISNLRETLKAVKIVVSNALSHAESLQHYFVMLSTVEARDCLLKIKTALGEEKV